MYDEDSAKWWYRIEKCRTPFDVQIRLSAPTEALVEQSASESRASTVDAASHSGSDAIVLHSPSAGTSPQDQLFQTQLVPPEEILSHVSAAELEAFEGDIFRIQVIQEEADRQAREAKRKARAYRKSLLAGQLNIDIADVILSSETLSTDTSAGEWSHGPGRASKRKALVNLGSSPRKRRHADDSEEESRSRPHKGVSKAKHKSKNTEQEDNDELYVVAGLLDHRINDLTGGREFDVEWKNYPGENTWEPEENLPASKIKAYFKAIRAAERGRSISRVDDRKIESPAELRQSQQLDINQQEELRIELDADHENDQSDEFYEISHIIRDGIRNGRRMFKVAWVGYPGQDTWEPEDGLPTDMLLEYLNARDAIFHT